jgi:hypothetical protein
MKVNIEVLKPVCLTNALKHKKVCEETNIFLLISSLCLSVVANSLEVTPSLWPDCLSVKCFKTQHTSI